MTKKCKKCGKKLQFKRAKDFKIDSLYVVAIFSKYSDREILYAAVRDVSDVPTMLNHVEAMKEASIADLELDYSLFKIDKGGRTNLEPLDYYGIEQYTRRVSRPTLQ